MTAVTLDESPADPNMDRNEILQDLYYMMERGYRVDRTASLLTYGQLFKHVDSIPDHLDVEPIGDCYANCAHALKPYLADVHPPFYYAEGYALHPAYGYMSEHAWLVDNHGRAIDLTWKDCSKAVYFGVKFKGEFIYQAIRETSLFGVFCNDSLENSLFSDLKAFEALLCQPITPSLPLGRSR